MMTLGQFGAMAPLVVRRDAEIETLGFVEIFLAGRFVYAEDHAYLERALEADGVAAVLTTPALADAHRQTEVGWAVAEDPALTFCNLHNHLARDTDFYGAAFATSIHPTAKIHPRAHVDPTGVRIGADCSIGAGCFVLAGSSLARGVKVCPGAIVGGEGFQTIDVGGALASFDHAGRVEVSEGATIFSNAVVARAVFNQATIVGAYGLVGNNALLSHGSSLGARSRIGHGAVVAGNTAIGADVRLGAGSVCVDRISIGDGAMVSAGSVVSKSVPAGARVSAGGSRIFGGSAVRPPAEEDLDRT